MAESQVLVLGVWTFWETGTFPIPKVHQGLLNIYIDWSSDPGVPGPHRGLRALSVATMGSGWLLVVEAVIFRDFVCFLLHFIQGDFPFYL